MKSKLQWFRHVMVCETVRHDLYNGEEKTPYFIDVASRRAHFTAGQRVGLFGAGMSAPNSRGQRIAACLGSYDALTPAKARAEELAVSRAVLVRSGDAITLTLGSVAL